MTLHEIKNNLDPSDAAFIAKSTGYSVDMVRKVLNGHRNNKTILEAAKIVVANHKSLEEQISAMAGE